MEYRVHTVSQQKPCVFLGVWNDSFHKLNETSVIQDEIQRGIIDAKVLQPC